MRVKPRSFGKVTYVFQGLPEPEPRNEIEEVKPNFRNSNEEGESLSHILQQKERIRSLITPGDEEGYRNSLLDDGCRKEAVVKN